MPNTFVSTEVAQALVAERIAVLTVAIDTLPEEAALRAFLLDIRQHCQIVAEQLDRFSVERMLKVLEIAALNASTDGSWPGFVALTDIHVALSGITMTEVRSHV